MSRGDARQLGLRLEPPPALGRADFLAAAPNALALALVSDPGGLPQGRLVIHGPEGSGKTHLAAIWATEAGAHWLDPTRLAADLPALLAPDAPSGLVLDSAATIAGHPPAEEALFHLLNHRDATGGAILLCDRAPARDWGVTLPDLASRLTASVHAPLGAPDDTLLTALLVKLFADRRAEVAPDLILWLVRRIERSFAAAQAVVAHLDAEAVRLRQPITRSLAQRALAGMPGFGDGGLPSPS
jgi:chromosomal replication initiation ATPase DnaA